MKKIFSITSKIVVISVIINASLGGRLQVMINCEEVVEGGMLNNNNGKSKSVD